MEITYRDILVRVLTEQCLQSPRYGAEVGVHRGKTGFRLLHEFHLMHLYLVDHWTVATSQAYLDTKDPHARFTQEQQDQWYRETAERLRPCGNRYEILRMDSVAAIEFMQPLDVAFIDGDHSHAGCLRDIEAYWQQVRKGGILCGHDYAKEDCPGVTKAVEEAAQKFNFDLHAEKCNIWWTRKA